jgi:transketolase
MRLGRQPAVVLHPEGVEFRIGRMLRLREGRDVTIIALGNMVEQALIAADMLAAEGIGARVLDCHTVKPVDREEILLAAAETRGIVTAEDHNVVGGLGAAVCEVVSEARPTLVRRVGLGDRFAGSGRDYAALLRHYGLDAAAIARQAREIARVNSTHRTK